MEALNRIRGHFKWKRKYNIIKKYLEAIEDFKSRKKRLEYWYRKY